MNEWLKGWLASETANQDKIEVKRIYIDLNEGNLYDGVIFSQIMYWHGTNRETHKPRMTIERDGQLWLAKGYGDWFIECRIVETTARKCIARIEKRGLIIKRLWKFNNIPTVHLRIDWDQLEEQLKLICPDVSNGFDTTGQMGFDTTGQINLIPQVKSLTDTTPNTTSETKTKKPRTPSKSKPLTDLEQWRIRLRMVEPIMSAILAKMERGFDVQFHTPETYMNLALLEKYVPLAEEIFFYKPTQQQWFAFYGEISQEYNRNGWTVGIKTVREKFPGYMARQNTAAQKKAAPPTNITPVDIELTPAEVEARKQQLAAVLKGEVAS